MMWVLNRSLAMAFAGLAVSTLCGCGAGLISGVAASGGGGSSGPEARIPQLNIAQGILPLVPYVGDVRSVIVADAQLVGGQIDVIIERDDGESGVAMQKNVIAEAQGGSTIVTFELDLSPISQSLANPSAADIPARLLVLVSGEPVADPISIVLARQPVAKLVPTGNENELSPVGQRIVISVDGLLSTSSQDLEVLVIMRDPDGGDPGARLTRLASNIAFEHVSSSLPTISASIPGSSIPDAVEIVVRDPVAGQSTSILNAYYRPDVAIAVPGQGPTTGGSRVTLVGSALVPYDFESNPAAPDFSKVSLSFAKGGRVLDLPVEDFRAEDSNSERLVFMIPPSPDGRPGEVEIRVKAELFVGGALKDVIVTAKLFLFANPDPYYGPRGAILDQPPVAAVPIALDSATYSPANRQKVAPDFAILTEQGGVGFLQLLLAEQNGMFQRFGAPRQVGNNEEARERNPRDLVVADFNGDGIPDLFVVNEGVACGDAVHHVVLGQSAPEPPLGDVFRVPAQGGFSRGYTADFNGDQLPDILLVPSPTSTCTNSLKPQVYLSTCVNCGEPQFTHAGDLEFPAYPYEAIEIADFDRDSYLDVAAVSGTELILTVAWGRGNAQFTIGEPLAFTIEGYAKDRKSPAVGLHACKDGTQLTWESLALVLSGKAGSSATPPTVAVLKQPNERSFVGPLEDGLFFAPAVDPIGMSLAADLDGSQLPGSQSPPRIELVVAIAGEPTLVSIGLLQLDESGDSFLPVNGSIEAGTGGGTEVPVQISSLAFATAFPAENGLSEAKAVFVVHEVDVDGSRERRISTRLVKVISVNQPFLLPPDAGATLENRIDKVVGGNFSDLSVQSQGATSDLAVVASNAQKNYRGIEIVTNDGFGGFPALGNRMTTQEVLLASSVSLFSSDTPNEFDYLVFATEQSELGIWRHDPLGALNQSPDYLSDKLRGIIAGETRDLVEGTSIQIADVNGDGNRDLIVLMAFEANGQDWGDAYIAVLLSRGALLTGLAEFPFALPTELCPIHGKASSFAIGDFVFGGSPELAVAIPQDTNPNTADGNHITFYRYVQSSEPLNGKFVRSAVQGGPQALLAGSEPTLVVASDFDRDGSEDLLVACSGDGTLRLFRNVSAPGQGAADVDISAFSEVLGLQTNLPAGLPTCLRLSDVNGDGNLDGVVVVQDNSPNGLGTAVATYLSSGDGQFSDARFASSTRIGQYNASMSLDIGDWNRDNVPDLFLGWAVAGGGSEVNLRVLFGGTR